MAVEEVVLSVPGQSESSDASEGSRSSAGAALEQVIRDYLRSSAVRSHLAIGNWMRQRRYERFELALKALVKTIAAEASRNVQDRSTRLDVRTQVYGSVMSLARAMADEHGAVVRRARTTLIWGVGFIVIGAAGLISTLILDGWFIAA